MDVVTKNEIKAGETAASAIAAQEVSFFMAHPKAIAIGAGIAGVIVGWFLHHFI